MLTIEETTVEDMIKWCSKECTRIHQDISGMTFLGRGGGIRNTLNRMRELTRTLEKMAEIDKW